MGNFNPVRGIVSRLAITCALMTVCSSAAADDNTCYPSCREGYLCHQGECIQACNPACEDGYRCTAERRCVLEQRPTGITATDLLPSPELTGRYFAFGFGPDVGEYAGGTGELEVGFGSSRHHFALMGSGGGGLSMGSGNPKAFGSGTLGYRGLFGWGRSFFTLLLGMETAYLVAFEREEAYVPGEGYRSDIQYEYVIPMGRFGLGWWWPMSDSGFWSVEVSGSFGERIHLNVSENPFGEDYSGFSGFFRSRVRFIF